MKKYYNLLSFYFIEKQKTECKPNLCSFPSLDPCEQRCTYTQTSTLYKCECTADYDVNPSDANKCVLKKDHTCNCKGNNIFCSGGPDKCECRAGFKLAQDQKSCEPAANSMLHH